MIKKVLFVCTGNTCRSPMAEAIFKRMLKERNLDDRYSCSSAGVYAFEGDCASPEAISVAMQNGLDLKNHYARVLNFDMVKDAYIIFTMTRDHKRKVLDVYPESQDKIFTLKEFDEYDACDRDIIDPFGKDEKAYLDCIREIETVLSKILDRL
ncbi:MAG: low molecular weight protein arginine phosphatase [Clostridiaceae bacterium]|jgi:protein-tyrosine phosphatase|nr:low molecular weight protein arginine phosphatase [Clostridiaceae bacterium]